MTGIRISSRIRLAYLQALFKQPIRVFDELPIGRPTTTITTSANAVQAGISDKIAALVQAVATLIGAYAVSFRYSWALTLVSSSCLLFMLIIYCICVPMYIDIHKHLELADEQSSSIAGEVLGTIRTIVACGAEGRIASRHAAWVNESRKRGLRLSLVAGFQMFPSGFAMYANYALTFWFGIKLYASGSIADVGSVVMFVLSYPPSCQGIAC